MKQAKINDLKSFKMGFFSINPLYIVLIDSNNQINIEYILMHTPCKLKLVRQYKATYKQQLGNSNCKQKDIK